MAGLKNIFNELNELPDNFNDEKYLERLMKEVDILSKARDGILTDVEERKQSSLQTFFNKTEKLNLLMN